jgi:hypothetical protein
MAKDNWKKLLKADPTGWLLEEENSDPTSVAVRYLTLRDITDASEKEVKIARTKAHKEGPIATILENMNPEGYWITPGLGYTPKFKSTVWSLISLGQLGASGETDKRVKMACAYFLDHAWVKGGQFNQGKTTDMGLCLQGNMLTALMDLVCTDKRLDTAYDYTARRLTGEELPQKVNAQGLPPGEDVEGPFHYLKYITDPIFGCRTNKGLACAWAGVSVMNAFSRLPAAQHTGVIDRAIKAGTAFFFRVNPATADFRDSKTGAPDEKWWQFKFPDFYAADILKMAEALVALGYGKDPRLANTLQMIRDKQQPDGTWLLDYVDTTRKMWVNYGRQGQPSKWVTLRAMRVLKQAANTR